MICLSLESLALALHKEPLEEAGQKREQMDCAIERWSTRRRPWY